MTETKDDWFGASLQTDGTPMVDAGTGRALILRVFDFAFKPGLQQKPSKQQLFNAHWPHLKTIIWADGLTANTDIDPRVVIGKKRYRIFILCEPRLRKSGVRETVVDRPATLQEVFKKPSP